MPRKKKINDQKKIIDQKKLSMRQKLWPDIADDRLWSTTKGWLTVPRALPLLMRIMDALADKGKPVSPTYLDLWCRTYNDDSFVIAAKPHEMAFYAGFSGQRAQNTWMARIRQLVDLGFILISDGASGPAHYILILNPYHVIRRHIDEGKIQAAFANALAERMLEIGADDLDNTSVQD